MRGVHHAVEFGGKLADLAADLLQRHRPALARLLGRLPLLAGRGQRLGQPGQGQRGALGHGPGHDRLPRSRWSGGPPRAALACRSAAAAATSASARPAMARSRSSAVLTSSRASISAFRAGVTCPARASRPGAGSASSRGPLPQRLPWTRRRPGLAVRRPAAASASARLASSWATEAWLSSCARCAASMAASSRSPRHGPPAPRRPAGRAGRKPPPPPRHLAAAPPGPGHRLAGLLLGRHGQRELRGGLLAASVPASSPAAASSAALRRVSTLGGRAEPPEAQCAPSTSPCRVTTRSAGCALTSSRAWPVGGHDDPGQQPGQGRRPARPGPAPGRARAGRLRQPRSPGGSPRIRRRRRIRPARPGGDHQAGAARVLVFSASRMATAASRPVDRHCVRRAAQRGRDGFLRPVLHGHQGATAPSTPLNLPGSASSAARGVLAAAQRVQALPQRLHPGPQGGPLGAGLPLGGAQLA